MADANRELDAVIVWCDGLDGGTRSPEHRGAYEVGGQSSGV